MSCLHSFVHGKFTSTIFPGILVLLALSWQGPAAAQEAPSTQPAPIVRPNSNGVVQDQQEQQGQQDELPPHHSPTPSHYDKTLFLKPLPAADLDFLKQYDGRPALELMHDKQFHKLLKNIAPDCMFHYGRDMSLDEALSLVLDKSRNPVSLRDGRYLTVPGVAGPILGGRGFVWIDLQDGIGLGGFYFHPTNGEPTPTLAVFSRQIKTDALSMSELPPAFAEDLARWTGETSLPRITTRYFLTGSNKRILLEHDEDYCAPTDGSIAPPNDACEDMDADAADIDVNAAYYLDAVHYATNATAWMMSPEQTSFIQIRQRTCGGLRDPRPCLIRINRERIHVIVHRPGGPGPRPRR